MVLPPGLFSTMTCWPSSSPTFWDSIRGTISAADPGPTGTTIVIGRLGNPSALAVDAVATAMHARSIATHLLA
jgi:hypothetical protein